MTDLNGLLEPIEEPSTPGQVMSGELSWLRHLVAPGTSTPQSSGQLQDKSAECGCVPPLQKQELEPLPNNVDELGEKLFACDQCDYKTGRSRYLKGHQSTVHAIEKPYTCDQCSYKAAVGSLLKQHMKRHSGEKPFGCDVCDFKTSSRRSLKLHLKQHTGEKPYACGECDYKTFTSKQLKQHKMHHTGEKPFACDECDFKTTNSQLLRIHKMGRHSGEKLFACDECDYKTSWPYILRRHKMGHSGETRHNEEKVIICDQCGYKCFTRANLKLHMRRHTGERPYACDQCSFRFADATNLRKHRRIHSGDKRYACDQCSFKSNLGSSLRRHLRIHSGEKPFACDLCEFRAAQSNHLNIHRRIYHTGEKPFACEECDFKSAQSRSLKAHKKIHLKKLLDKKGRKIMQKRPTKKVKKTKTDKNESRNDAHDAWGNPDVPSSNEGNAELCQIPEDPDEDDQFTTSDELLVKIHDFIQKELLSIEFRDDQLFIFKLDTNPYLRVKYSLAINKELDVTVVYSGVELNEISGYKFPFRSSNTFDIQAILSRLDGMTGGLDSSVVEKTTVINNLLSSLASDDNENQIRFLNEQIELTAQSKNDLYSPETMAFFSVLYTISPHSYKYIRQSHYLKVPHPTELEQLTSNMQCDEQQSFFKEMGLNSFNYKPNLKHARNVFRHTSECDRTVVILMDQISIKPFFDFKNGVVVDLAQDSQELASTVHTFTISSIGSTFKELVHIMPVQSFPAETMHYVLKKLIVRLEKVGFRVVGIVSDNQSLSREAVSHFSSPPLLSIAYLHPCDKHRPLFYVIDPAHITKSIRNNWIDSKQQQTIVYPKFHPENDNVSSKAAFSDIKQLFEHESVNPDSRSSPLTSKAVYPSKSERENMKLVLQVFNTAVIEGLNSLSENSIRDCNGCSEFIKIIVEFCKVLDITMPSKTQFADDLQKLVKLKSVSSGTQFLDGMLIWLDKWEQLKNDSLWTETISILKHSSYAIAEIIQYCIDELKIVYFLPRKLQVDALERQFGQYRLLPGSLFHVSLPQLSQFETKLGLRHFSLVVKTKINVHLRNINPCAYYDVEVGENDVEEGGYDVEEGEFPPTTNFHVEVVDSDLRNVEDILPILVYISGYCSKKMLSRYNECNSCASVFVQEASLAESNSCPLISALSRDGLNVPQDFCLTVTVYCYTVFTKILNNQYLKTEFSKIVTQRNVLLKIVLDALYLRDILVIGECMEGPSVLDTTKKFVWTTCNTLMNIFRWDPNKIVKQASSRVNNSISSVNKVSKIAESPSTTKKSKRIIEIKSPTKNNLCVVSANPKTQRKTKNKISYTSKVS